MQAVKEDVKLLEEASSILKDPSIRNYLVTKELLEGNTESFTKDDCPHFIWTVPETLWEYAKFQDVECLICKKRQIMTHEEALKLYKQKKLIGVRNKFDSRYIPLEDASLEEIRKYALMVYEIIERLAAEHYNVDFFSPEEAVFSHFCEEPKVKKITK